MAGANLCRQDATCDWKQQEDVILDKNTQLIVPASAGVSTNRTILNIGSRDKERTPLQDNSSQMSFVQL